MEKIKYTQKELKQPDKFRSFIIKLINIAEENFNKILYVFLVVLLLLVIFSGFNLYKNKKSESAGVELADALELYQNGNIEEALGKFSDIVLRYPNEKSAKLSTYYLGTLYYDSNDYEKSIEEMLKYVESKDDNWVLKDSGNLIIGLSYYNLQKWEEAVDFLSKVSDSNRFYERSAKINLALVYQKMGQDEKAQDLYKLILLN